MKDLKTAESIFLQHRDTFHPVVSFDPSSDRLLVMDFTAANKTLSNNIIEDTAGFSVYIKQQLANADARYGIGGYAEHRTVYSRSGVFDADTAGEEPRRLHLGTDIWGDAGTPVYAPLDGVVHSFAFNNRYGDYGATIITRHELEGIPFHILYGHLSVKDLEPLLVNMVIHAGAVLAHFGTPEDNGHWPPHLHFQLIYDLGDMQGDYPGVCKYSEKEKYLANSPDPDLILNMNRFIGSD